MVFTYTTNKGD